MSEWTIRMLANEHCHTGENPLWDARRNCVFWTDIPNGKLFQYAFATGTHRQIYSGDPVGGFCLQEDDSLLLFRVHDIAVLPPGGEARVLVAYSDSTMERFNDVLVAPDGRVFVGTIGKGTVIGGLYRVDYDGLVTKVAAGTGTANGSAVSADLKTFFWTDSTHKRILQFDFHSPTGELSNQRTLFQVPEGEGTPDGMCIDAQDNLWSARWDGGMVVKISPDGRELGRIEMPVKTVSCPCFGGETLDRLYVTTANQGKKDLEAAQDGALFEVAGDFKGRACHRSRILLGE